MVFTKHFDVSQVFGKNHTCVGKTTHIIVQGIIGNSHTCLVFTTHMKVLEIGGNSHICVVFSKQAKLGLKSRGCHRHMEHMGAWSVKI